MKGRRDAGARNERHAPRTRGPLTAHPLFAAVLGLWGAALGGLVTLVLPRTLVLKACAGIGLAQLGETAPFVLAALAALVLGGALFALGSGMARLARAARRRKAAPSLAAMAAQPVRPIDPVSELGSASLDEPVETMPFAGLKPVLAAEDGEADVPCPTGESHPPPLEPDLEAFGALPGRNAVWVEGPEPLTRESVSEAADQAETLPETGSGTTAGAGPALSPAAARRMPPPPSPSAIERLRAVPPSELSLVQMVERFAAALHAHQSAAPGLARHPTDQAARDAALAEALKALAALNGEGKTSAQGEPLRAALARLQELRGAA
jgi:hypothetical protein